MKRAAVKGRFIKERLPIVTYVTMITVKNIYKQKRKHIYQLLLFLINITNRVTFNCQNIGECCTLLLCLALSCHSTKAQISCRFKALSACSSGLGYPKTCEIILDSVIYESESLASC